MKNRRMENSLSKAQYCHAENRAFRGILDKWIITQKFYAKRVNGDYSWNYRERPCIGFLAAATWLSGGVALEEWRTEKDREGAKGYGRCDVWLQAKEKTEFFIEAKHKHLTLHNATRRQIDKKFSKISEQLDIAAEAANQHSVKEPKSSPVRVFKMAILFVGLTFQSQKMVDIMSTRVELLKKCNILRPDAIAWLFQNAPSLVESEFQYRGILLLARRVK